MNWNAIQFDWNHARSFLVTAEEGSLSAAARALDTTQPTIGRQVAALEQELGVSLFERGNKGLELTPNGLALLEHVKGMANAANQLSLVASGQSESLEGTITISATEVMAAVVLPPLLIKLRQLQPGIIIDLIASDETSDLRRREADLAIRAYRPDQPDLIAKKLREEKYKLFAAKSYLEQIENPKTVDDLSDLDFVGYNRSEQYLEILNRSGLNLTMENFKLFVEGSLSNWELVKRGLGIGAMVKEIGDQEPLVQIILPEINFPTGELWLVAHRELRTNRRLKFVFDFLVKELS